MSAFKGDMDTKKKKGANPTVEQNCEAALYRTEGGTIYVPALQIEASMKNASREFKFQGRKSYWEIMTSGVFAEPNQISMVPQTFTPFVTAVRIPPRTGAHIMKGRPMFENWSLKFNLVVTDERMLESQLKEILKEAGQSKGIGDWRPRFGLFEITSWKK